MEIELNTGSQEKAKTFINSIGKKDKVALISHIDFDGLASAKIINQLLAPDLIKFIHYKDIDSPLINELKDKRINKAIFTDLSFNVPEIINEIENFSNVLIIDHHQFKKDFNSDKTIFINSQGYCAAYICYELFKNAKVEKLDWLAAMASIADYMHQKNPKFLKNTYKKYGEKFNIEKPRQGKLWDIIEKTALALIYTQPDLKKAYDVIGEDLQSLKKLEPLALEVKKSIDKNKQNFEKGKEKIKNGFFYELKSKFNIDSEFATEISGEDIHKTYIISLNRGDFYKISARQQDKKRNMAELLQEVTKDMECKDAGGHIAAAGARVALNDYEEFKRRLKNPAI